MKKAIVLPYASYQNEPSQPLPWLVDVPDTVDELKALVRELMLKHVCDNEEVVDTCIFTYDCGFGDVCFGDGDVFVFLTYVRESDETDEVT